MPSLSLQKRALSPRYMFSDAFISQWTIGFCPVVKSRSDFTMSLTFYDVRNSMLTLGHYRLLTKTYVNSHHLRADLHRWRTAPSFTLIFLRSPNEPDGDVGFNLSTTMGNRPPNYFFLASKRQDHTFFSQSLLG